MGAGTTLEGASEMTDNEIASGQSEKEQQLDTHTHTPNIFCCVDIWMLSNTCVFVGSFYAMWY